MWQGDGVPTAPLPGQDQDMGLAAAMAGLIADGAAQVAGRWPDHVAAWRAALRITSQARALDPLCAGLPALAVVGEFTLPPPGTVQRGFQALHIDYGIPRLAGPPVDIARFTALYLDPAKAGSGAATRIVPLRPLLTQRPWPAPGVIAQRLCGDAGPGRLVEGILARIIEAADHSTDLPAPGSDGFLCGMEFPTLAAERRYFARHGLPLKATEQQIVLSGGELLLFDNLAVAHGRRGQRSPGELHQLCIGFPALGLAGQRRLLHHILATFSGH
jgi:hypothetical protein